MRKKIHQFPEGWKEIALAELFEEKDLEALNGLVRDLLRWADDEAKKTFAQNKAMLLMSPKAVDRLKDFLRPHQEALLKKNVLMPYLAYWIVHEMVKGTLDAE